MDISGKTGFVDKWMARKMINGWMEDWLNK